MTDDATPRSVNLLQFTGAQEPPTPLDEVYQRPPELPTSEPPPDFLQIRDRRVFYVPRDDQQDVQIAEVAPDGADQDYPPVVRVSLPAPSGAAQLALPGRTAVRSAPADIAASVDPAVDFTGFRPEWAALAPTPRPLPGGGAPQDLQRINGRTTRPLYVFPPDDRAQYRDTTWPWGVVGKVFTSAGWVGSGALIGPRLVVTAGHVVPWGAASWWMRFVPAYYDGVSLHGSGIESYVSDTRGYNTSGDVTGYDWAILRLYQPLGSWLGYFGYNGYSDSWRNAPYWTLLGYPGAVASGLRPSWQGSVSIFDEDSDSNGGRELETRADATPGNSGGPLFGWWSGDPRIIGVVSGEETDWIFPIGGEMGNVIASGSGFTNLVAWGRTNWP